MKVKYSRERFDPKRPLVCNRLFLVNGRQVIYGDVFDKSAVLPVRARQMYDMRKLEHLDTFVATIDPTPVSRTPAPILTDDAGVPWYPDFYADTKEKKTNGRWKLKRGVDRAALAVYEAQFIEAPQ
jgi:hypothetical protein